MGRLWRSETASVFYRRLIEPKFAATIIAVITLVVRLLPMRFEYLLGYDPYFHLAYIRYSLERGEWVNFITYAGGPWGYQISGFHPLGLWMTPAYFYKFLSLFGVSLYNAFRITPVIFGVLTVVFTYLTVLRLHGKREAFLSAFILAVSFGHVFRSMAGYYRGDNYMLFLYSVALLGTAVPLSLRGPKWRNVRLVLYLFPGIFAGLSAAFWQAYYPIFALVTSNALLIAVGGFLLGRDRYLKDALVLIASLAAGALLANSIGSHLGYGMVGATHWLGRKLAEELGIQFGFIGDLFLLLYLKYIIPLTAAAVLVLLVLSRLVRDRRVRGAVVLLGAVASVWLAFRYYGILNDALLRLFPTSPISETQRTTFGDWWEAYGISGLMVPLFLFRFLKRPRVGDFLLLGTALVMIPMAVVWTRFLFISSLAVAAMAGIGLVALYDTMGALIEGLSEDKRRWLSAALSLLLIGVPLISAYQGTSTTLSVHPFMTEEWESALTYLGKISNPNDVVMTWWDQGHWVTYYSMRPPVAQGGPSKWVAQYYLGLKGEKDLMKPGVDYVIVSYDTLTKFGAVVDTAGASSGDYVLMVLPWAGSYGNLMVFSRGPYSVMAAPGDMEWDVKVRAGKGVVIPKRAFVERGNVVREVNVSGAPTADAYVYINLNYGYAVLMNGRAFDTPLARLMFTDDYSGNYTQVYSDGGYVKIFRFEHPNVAVAAENGSVVLRFTNATGTGLGIYGYLDNGTLVFKKWYGVGGKDAFVLPTDINGSAVVRYVYVRKKTVLDRGVFRIDDVLFGASDTD
ncbi:oligosaccharyl transferase, STT3 subunit [Thermococcus celericrescens]|uniref:dolichyl-phosphooligosaccharide-protein glycotransferase n=1 Tax=Thermococcus celericrescens TaxID=227598 RepID=A0A100XZH6_9EURY|nr:STT3 domain-containing protein [Thermococcus celericrescens]KUH34435.1 oligosaccharyl transferase, STT3 subunit [Thermococcus celericrescens]